MNQQIDNYIESLVVQCLHLPGFAVLSLSQQNQIAQNLRERFYQIILETIIDHLDSRQLQQLENLDPQGIQMQVKIQEFASQIPNLAKDIDQKLIEEIEKIAQIHH